MRLARFLVSRLSKVDLKDAYRCVTIHKDDWRYLGMQLQDKYLCDRCLPMGLGSSCRIFTEISNALAWIFTQHNPKATVFNYLYDFLIVAYEIIERILAVINLFKPLEFMPFFLSCLKRESLELQDDTILSMCEIKVRWSSNVTPKNMTSLDGKIDTLSKSKTWS